MSDNRLPNDVTAAQRRGEIDAGAMGDKKAGFDPAAAPMETDGEAAGARADQAAPADIVSQPRSAPPRDMQDSDGDAMRKMPSGTRRPVRSFATPFVLIMSALLLAGMVVASLTG